MTRKRTVPKPAATLSVESRKWFDTIRRDYGVVDSGGLSLLELAAQALDRIHECQDAVARDGALVLDRFSQRKAHPLLAVERDARGQFLAAMRELHLDVEPLNPGPGRPPGR
jgi:hypothetical protein